MSLKKSKYWISERIFWKVTKIKPLFQNQTGEQEIFSFWTISKMQHLELLNHNHVHKHWKLVEALRKKNVEEKALVEVQKAPNRLNKVVSPVEAAKRASEYIIKKDNRANNDI
jgi:hypothetical protein